MADIEQAQVSEPEATEQDIDQATIDAYNRTVNNKIGSEDAKTATPEPEAEQAPEEQEPEQATEAPADETEPPATAEESEVDRLRAELNRTNQMLTGKIGELNRIIQQMAKPAAPETTGAPPASAKISAGAFKKLSDEFGEDLAEAFVDGLSQLPIGQGVDENALVAKIRDSLHESSQEEKMEVVLDEHPDFYAVRETPEFKKWRSEQSADFQKRLAASQNPFFIVRTMTSFKDAMKKAATTAAANKQRLESAVTPRGVPGKTSSTLPDEAGVTIGYNRRKSS